MMSSNAFRTYKREQEDTLQALRLSTPTAPVPYNLLNGDLVMEWEYMAECVNGTWAIMVTPMYGDAFMACTYPSTPLELAISSIDRELVWLEDDALPF